MSSKKDPFYLNSALGYNNGCCMLMEGCSKKAHVSGCYTMMEGCSKKAHGCYTRMEGCLKRAHGDNSSFYRGSGGGSSSYVRPMVSESTTLFLNEIVTTLTQPNIIKLGLYGSSAARNCKVDQIDRRVKRDGVFDEVVIASVVKKDTWRSKSLDVIKLQEELGNKLGLQLHDKTTPEERATCLRDGIKTKEKILIILNDLWCGIDLGEIGIPFGDHHKGCKIVLLAENQEVLSNDMKTDKECFVV